MQESGKNTPTLKSFKKSCQPDPSDLDFYKKNPNQQITDEQIEKCINAHKEPLREYDRISKLKANYSKRFKTGEELKDETFNGQVELTVGDDKFGYVVVYPFADEKNKIRFFNLVNELQIKLEKLKSIQKKRLRVSNTLTESTELGQRIEKIILELDSISEALQIEGFRHTYLSLFPGKEHQIRKRLFYYCLGCIAALQHDSKLRSLKEWLNYFDDRGEDEIKDFIPTPVEPVNMKVPWGDETIIEAAQEAQTHRLNPHWKYALICLWHIIPVMINPRFF